VKDFSEPMSDTPARRRGEARGRILDEAQALFAAHGYDATSTAKIAQKADLPAGLIFYHFKTKLGLLQALISERGGHTFPIVDGPDGRTIHSVLSTAAEQLVTDLTGSQRALRTIIFREAALYAEVRAQTMEIVEATSTAIAAQLCNTTDLAVPIAECQRAARLLIAEVVIDTLLRDDSSTPVAIDGVVQFLARALT
jgi:AcrR family transcriptional regulator